MVESGRMKNYYGKEEIESMNVIFGKNEGNNWFTRDELSFASQVNLLDFDLTEVRNEWKNNFID